MRVSGTLSGVFMTFNKGGLFFSFVSRLLASRIHEVGDLEKNPLVLSGCADYTKISEN